MYGEDAAAPLPPNGVSLTRPGRMHVKTTDAEEDEGGREEGEGEESGEEEPEDDAAVIIAIIAALRKAALHSSMELTGTPLTWVMLSPGCTPARSAGLSTHTDSTSCR